MIGGILEELYIPTSLYSRHPLVEMEIHGLWRWPGWLMRLA